MVNIVVPVFKVENYIVRCIASILEQSYRDTEIIIVDDGSPDNCGHICDEYAQKDSRIMVIHKHNSGLSSARNTGIRISNGEYICFIDSDDWVSNRFIDKQLIQLNEYKADMAACILYKVLSYDVILPKDDIHTEVIQGDSRYLYALREEYYGGFATNKLYKLSIIKENVLLFDENIKNGEDLPFIIEYLNCCNDVIFIHDNLYYYYYHDGTITTSVNFNDRRYTVLYAREKVLSLLKEADSEYYDIALSGYIEHLIKMWYLLKPNAKEYSTEYMDVSTKLRKMKSKIMKLKHVNYRQKLKLLIMVYFRGIIGRIYRKTKVV